MLGFGTNSINVWRAVSSRIFNRFGHPLNGMCSPTSTSTLLTLTAPKTTSKPLLLWEFRSGKSKIIVDIYFHLPNSQRESCLQVEVRVLRSHKTKELVREYFVPETSLNRLNIRILQSKHYCYSWICLGTRWLQRFQSGWLSTHILVLMVEASPSFKFSRNSFRHVGFAQKWFWVSVGTGSHWVRPVHQKHGWVLETLTRRTGRAWRPRLPTLNAVVSFL